ALKLAVTRAKLNPSPRTARSPEASTAHGAHPDLPEASFGASPVSSGTRFLTRRRTIDARFSGSVSVGPLYHTHDHQDFLLAGHRLDRSVRPVRGLLGACRDGDQPVRRI